LTDTNLIELSVKDLNTAWDRNLIAKYNVNGPRYTSYPTALQFRDDFQTEQYSSALGQLGEDRRAPISLYMHIPF